MQLIDILRHMKTSDRIQIGDYHDKSNRQFKRTQIMKVGNIPWEKLRKWEYRNVYQFAACSDKNGPYLYVGINDSERDFYNRNR